MNESIQLVVKFLFFNIGLPVLSVSSGITGINPDLRDVQVQSSVEYLSEYGKVMVKRVSSLSQFTVSVYEEPNLYDDSWIYDFGIEELLKAEKSDQHERVQQDRKNIKLTKKLLTTAPGFLDSKATDTFKRHGENNQAIEEEKSSIKKEAQKLNTAKYAITLSRPNYILFKIFKLFNIKKALLKYEYTELDYIPVIIQVILHIPLILTGIIIFIVLMTLDPELNANLVKSEIEKLSSAKYTKDMDLPNCPVCLDEFVEEQEIRILSCRHGFHKECIDAWLIHTLKCPICRKSVSSMSEAPQFEIYQTYYYV